jgi:hypothetical protein
MLSHLPHLGEENIPLLMDAAQQANLYNEKGRSNTTEISSAGTF